VQEGREAVEQHVADPAAEYGTQRPIDHEVIHLFRSQHRARTSSTEPAQPPGSEKADGIHQTVPAHGQRPKLERYRIEIWIDEHGELSLMRRAVSLTWGLG